MKHFIGSIIPFLLFHIVCCGGFLIFLTTSGYLLLVRQEGTDKLFLLPLLAISIIFFALYMRKIKQCKMKNHSTMMDKGIIVMVLLLWFMCSFPGGFLIIKVVCCCHNFSSSSFLHFPFIILSYY